MRPGGRTAPFPPQIDGDDGVPTKVQGLGALRARHWVLMAFGAAVPLAVWSLVALTLLGAGKDKGPVKGAPVPSAEAPLPSVTGAPSLPR